LRNESVGLWSEASCALHRDWTRCRAVAGGSHASRCGYTSGSVDVEFGPASVCSRGKPQLRPHEWWSCKRGRLSRGGIVSAGKKHSNQNWHGPGESDCLIKTKHCDGRRAVLTQCDFCPVA